MQCLLCPEARLCQLCLLISLKRYFVERCVYWALVCTYWSRYSVWYYVLWHWEWSPFCLYIGPCKLCCLLISTLIMELSSSLAPISMYWSVPRWTFSIPPIELLFMYAANLNWVICDYIGNFLTCHITWAPLHLESLETRVLNSLFRLTTNKTSKLNIVCPSEGNPPVTSGFPSQRASIACASCHDIICHQLKPWT